MTEPTNQPDDVDTQEKLFATRLRQLRIGRGWNQSDLARELEKVGLNWRQQTVARAESEGRPLRLDEAHAIASVFGETVESMTATDEAQARDLSIKMSAAGELLLRSCTYYSEVDDEFEALYGHVPESELPAMIAALRPDLWKELHGQIPWELVERYQSLLQSLGPIYQRSKPLVPLAVSEGW